MNLLQIIALSLSPALAIVLFVYFLDKYEHEPIKLLSTSFLYGLISLVIALYLSDIIDQFLNLDKENLAELAIYAFVVIALVEESLKFLMVRGIVYYEKDFDEPFDGIVYAIMVGMGFATAENIIYFYFHGTDAVVTRMFFAVPAHATFAVIMGYFIGKSKFVYLDIHAKASDIKDLKKMKRLVLRKKLILGLTGLFCAVLAHGVYNYFLFIDFLPGLWVGSVLALVLGAYFAKEAVDKQQETSPYKPREEQKESQED